MGGGHSLALLFFPPVLCTCFLSPFLRFPEIFPGNLPGNRGQLLLLLLSSSASSSAPLRLLRRSRWEEGRKRILVAHRMHQALSCKKGNKKWKCSFFRNGPDDKGFRRGGDVWISVPVTGSEKTTKTILKNSDTIFVASSCSGYRAGILSRQTSFFRVKCHKGLSGKFRSKKCMVFSDQPFKIWL